MNSAESWVLPREPSAPQRTPFPWLAALTPLAMSLTLFLVTRSPVSLVFAFLGPVVLLLTRWMTKRAQQKKWVVECARYQDEVAGLLEQARRQHQRERNEWLRLHPSAFVLGFTPAASTVRLEGAASSVRTQQLKRQIETNPALPFGVESARAQKEDFSIGFEGVLARQITRRWQQFRVEKGGGHSHENGGSGNGSRVDSLRAQNGVTQTLEKTVIGRVGGRVVVPPDQPLQLQLEPLRPRLARMRDEQNAMRAQREHAELGAQNQRFVEKGPPGRSGLSAMVGLDEMDLPVAIDLVSEGPHALIAGTTGSGKSELLQTLIASLAERYPPNAAQFLLLDFKGGTSMQHLAKIPHCLEMLTDLEHERVSRTVSGLTAELRRRERILREHEISDISDLGSETVLSRLVIVVDEFATLITELPELHAVFTDIAARGRALGMHLVIATQRPTGAVRDALAANCALRFCLRVTSSADSHAVLGVADAAGFTVDQPGACAHSVSGQVSMPWRVARTSQQRIAEIALLWKSSAPATTPWLAPLPNILSIAEWPPCAEGSMYLGLNDDPDAQTQQRMLYTPRRDGPLIVLGARSTGKTNLCELLASQWGGGVAHTKMGRHGTVQHARIRFSDGDPERAWDQLHSLIETIDARGADSSEQNDAVDAGTLWIFDDIDHALQRLGADHAAAAIVLLGRALREGASGDALVFTASRASGQLTSLFSAGASRLFLRADTKEDHVLWGLPAQRYDPRASAGRASYRDQPLQLGLSRVSAQRSEIELVEVPEVPILAVVTSRPQAWPKLAEQVSPDAVLLRLDRDEISVPDANRIVMVGDSEDWLLHASVMMQLRTQAGWLFDKCTTAEIRQITRKATLPPPALHPRTAVFWNNEAGFRRVRLERRRAP